MLWKHEVLPTSRFGKLNKLVIVENWRTLSGQAVVNRAHLRSRPSGFHPLRIFRQP